MRKNQQEIASEFDRYHNNYSDAVDEALSFSGMKADFFARVKVGYICDITRAAFGDTRRLKALDVGCGVGMYHFLLTQAFEQLSGVDISSQCVKEASRENPEVQYKTYNGERLPYGDGEFDVVFTICTMHHVIPENWSNFISEMKRVLRVGGTAIVFEHNPLNPLTVKAVNRCAFDANAVLLKGTKTRALIKEAGFDALNLCYILSIPAKGGVLRKIDRIFSLLPLGAQYYVSAVKSG